MRRHTGKEPNVADPTDADAAAALVRIDELNAIVASLQSELTQLRSRLDPPTRSKPSRSRRDMFKATAGIAAAAAAGALFESPRPVAAETGGALIGGHRNYASYVTRLNNANITPNTTLGESLATARTLFWADNTDSSRDDAIGMRADGREHGIGINAFGGTGVQGTGTSVGVVGSGPTGLQGTGTDVGVIGTGLTGVEGTGTATGLTGVGPTGVHGKGIGTGVQGDGVTGVSGRGTGGGVLALGTGPDAVGLFAAGGKCAILLGALADTPPPARTDAHVAGEIEFDEDHTVWVCVADGTPGAWRKIGGPTTAGAFHAIDPARVYDSRWPANTPMTPGASRLVVVADRHDLSGTMTAADAVPAGATAIAYNLTVTRTSGSGYLSVNPGTTTIVGSSSINWFGDQQDLANGLIVAIDDQRRVAVFSGGGGTTDFIIDVTGYYR